MAVLALAPATATGGLLHGLGAESLEVRYRCAQALLHLHARAPELDLPRERLLAAALREAEGADHGTRHLDCVFAILELTLSGEPLQAALGALRSSDRRLRGTALEYLENVLPAGVRERLWPHVATDGAPVRSGRGVDAIRDDLLRSVSSLPAGPGRPRD